MQFRKLKANEISVRVKQVFCGKEDKIWAMCLLYKDARVDMDILDETVGTNNWQRKHESINGDIYCSVGIRYGNDDLWVWKQDCGTEGESGTEAEKSRASDSFKRACVNWGIGRELYTSPKIIVQLEEGEFEKKDNKVKATSKFGVKVAKIEYSDEGAIKHIEIVDRNGKLRYRA